MSVELEPQPVRSNPRGHRVLALMMLASTVVPAAACTDGGGGDGFIGGCNKFGVVAQNRWSPYGAGIYKEPNVLAKKDEKGFGGNEVVAVNGWIHGEAAYPDQSEPWNSDIWFHLANRPGWVNFAAVRGEPTTQDPTSLEEYGGKQAPAPTECEGTYKP